MHTNIPRRKTITARIFIAKHERIQAEPVNQLFESLFARLGDERKLPSPQLQEMFSRSFSDTNQFGLCPNMYELLHERTNRSQCCALLHLCTQSYESSEYTRNNEWTCSKLGIVTKKVRDTHGSHRESWIFSGSDLKNN